MRIPTAREETRFEETEQRTAHSESLPARNKPLANHNSAPRQSDESKPISAADLPQHNVGRQLEEEVRWEEHHESNGVSVADVEREVCAHTSDTSIGDVCAVDLRSVR